MLLPLEPLRLLELLGLNDFPLLYYTEMLNLHFLTCFVAPQTEIFTVSVFYDAVPSSQRDRLMFRLDLIGHPYQ